MTATYPSGQKSFSRRTDAVDDILATDVNQAYDEIEALEAELGLNPADKTGGTAGAYATVKARLDKAHRAATFVVAASDASADSRQFADYLCDGTADNVDINAAITAAGAGKVELSEGTFACTSRINLDGKSPLSLIGSGIPSFSQNKAPTLLTFTLGSAGNCIDVDNTASATTGPCHIADIGIEGVANCTNGIALGTAAHLCNFDRILINGTFSNAGYTSHSNSSQNRLYHVYTQHVTPYGFELGGGGNIYHGIQAMNDSVVASSKGIWIKDLRSSTLIAPFVYKAELAYDVGSSGGGNDITIVGPKVEASTNGYKFNGNVHNVSIFGGRVDATTHATQAAVLFTQCDNIHVFGLYVEANTSQKSFYADSSGTNILCVGCNALGTTPYSKHASASMTVRDDVGFNPQGALGPPAVPASTVAYTNAYMVDCQVYITGGTVTVIAIGSFTTGLTSGMFIVPAGQTITITYSSVPTWTWYGL